MQPAFYKGDLLFLAEAPANLTVGDIVVFKIPTKEIPVVHRVVNVHQRTEKGNEILEALTKGDNNELDDWKALIYTPDMRWVERQHLIGKVHGFLPYVGYITIVMNEFPPLKYLLLCVMAFFVIMKRESSSSSEIKKQLC
ncbi:Signal peptidase complex catalytic subunit S11C, variant 2 [Balamuthia mandrillaris]